MNKKSIMWFSEIDKISEESVGKKAYHLSEAYNKKLLSKKTSIPNGFVITKDAINDFLEKSGIKNAILNLTEDLDPKNQEELQRAEEQIKNLILKSNFEDNVLEELSESYEALGASKLDLEESSAYDILTNSTEPIFVAVRASNKNDKGDSYFNIKGNSAIISTIKKIIISLFANDNLTQNNEKTTAIIIQKMIQADKSGTVYSDDKLLIKSIWGLGGGLNQKEIGQDEYTIRRDGKILNKTIKEKKYAITRDSSGSLKAVTLKEGYSLAPTLDDSEIQELSDINLRLETIFSKKMNFHFAVEGDDIFIVTINESDKPQQEEKIDEFEPQEKETEEITETIKKAEEKQKSTTKEDEKNTREIEPVKEITKTKLKLLINSKEENESAEKTLLKSGILSLENIIRERGIHPLGYIENFNTKGYEEVLTSGLHENAAHLKEVWVKLSDFTTEDFNDLEDSDKINEKNPLMGLCGIRFLLSNPELLKRELKAIHSLSTKKQVGILIPKISSVYELKKVKEFIKNLDINLKIGIILETPASIQLIKDFITEGIDIAIFSGDTLTQYLLAIDKKNELTKEYYDDTNPALMYQLEYVIRVCKRQDIQTGFMGEALDKKEMIEYLIKKHIDSIIITPQKANQIQTQVKAAEEKHIEGTDKEPRQYEKNKEKERQEKELKEFEQMKNEQIEGDLASYKPDKEKSENLENNPEEIKDIEYEEIENLPEEVEKEIEEIEKQNKIENETPKEIENKEIEKQNETKKIESFDETPEKIEDIEYEEIEEIENIPEEIENEIEEIEKQNNTQKNETFDETPEKIEETKDEEIENQNNKEKSQELVNEETIDTPDFEEDFLENKKSEDENKDNKDILNIF